MSNRVFLVHSTLERIVCSIDRTEMDEIRLGSLYPKVVLPLRPDLVHLYFGYLQITNL